MLSAERLHISEAQAACERAAERLTDASNAAIKDPSFTSQLHYEACRGLFLQRCELLCQLILESGEHEKYCRLHPELKDLPVVWRQCFEDPALYPSIRQVIQLAEMTPGEAMRERADTKFTGPLARLRRAEAQLQRYPGKTCPRPECKSARLVHQDSYEEAHDRVTRTWRCEICSYTDTAVGIPFSGWSSEHQHAWYKKAAELRAHKYAIRCPTCGHENINARETGVIGIGTSEHIVLACKTEGCTFTEREVERSVSATGRVLLRRGALLVLVAVGLTVVGAIFRYALSYSPFQIDAPDASRAAQPSVHTTSRDPTFAMSQQELPRGGIVAPVGQTVQAKSGDTPVGDTTIVDRGSPVKDSGVPVGGSSATVSDTNTPVGNSSDPIGGSGTAVGGSVPVEDNPADVADAAKPQPLAENSRSPKAPDTAKMKQKVYHPCRTRAAVEISKFLSGTTLDLMKCNLKKNETLTVTIKGRPYVTGKRPDPGAWKGTLAIRFCFARKSGEEISDAECAREVKSPVPGPLDDRTQEIKATENYKALYKMPVIVKLENGINATLNFDQLKIEVKRSP